MQLSHTPAGMSEAFDEPNVIGCAGLVLVVGLCDRIGLRDLASAWIKVPGLAFGVPGQHVGYRRLIGGFPPSALWRLTVL